MVDNKDIIIHPETFTEEGKGVIFNLHGTASLNSYKMTVGGVEVSPDARLKIKALLNIPEELK